MGLRDSFTEALKAAMRGGLAVRTSTLRMILAKLKETDIAARPHGAVADSEIVAMLRGMVKSRKESVALYRQGNRPDLVAKENAEIAVIEEFLPPAMSEAELTAAVARAIAETGASAPRDVGRVMAALKAGHGGRIDLGRAGALVRERLAS